MSRDWNEQDRLVDMKEHGGDYLEKDKYKDIHMGKNTGVGLWMGIFMSIGGLLLMLECIVGGVMCLGGMLISMIWRSLEIDDGQEIGG